MKEITGNIWDYNNSYIVITTNGFVKSNGECAMGRGVALEAKTRYSKLPKELGSMIKDFGNHVYRFDQYKLLTFPVKHNWWEKADLSLIERSVQELKTATGFASGLNQLPIYMVRPGCSNGHLDWIDVKPILEKYLDDRYIVVEKNP